MFKNIILSFLFITMFSFKVIAQQSSQKLTLPFSETYKANNFMFISGQIGIDENTGKLVGSSFEAEANQVMKNIATLLKKEGLNFSDLVSVTIYLKNMDNYQLTNGVYSAYFKDKFPTRVCVAVSDLPAQANIEITAIASLKTN